MLKYNAILFDVDGTLIDSAPGILHTLEEVFHTMGVDTTNVNLRRYLGPPLRKSFGEHFSDKAKIEEAAERYRASYHEKGSHECAVFPGVPDMRGAADCGLDAAGALYGYGSREELEPFHPVILAKDCADLADQILHMAE